MAELTARIDVLCAACSGRADVDHAYRQLSQWACPFCGSSNPMPEAGASPEPQPPVPGSRGRVPWRSIAATLVLGAAVAASLALQSRMPRGEYRTVEGLLAAMADRGLACDAPVMDPAPAPGVRAAAACMVAGEPVWLMTFASSARRDRALAAWNPGRPAAIGSTWIAASSSEATARAIARAFDVRFTGE